MAARPPTRKCWGRKCHSRHPRHKSLHGTNDTDGRRFPPVFVSDEYDGHSRRGSLDLHRSQQAEAIHY